MFPCCWNTRSSFLPTRTFRSLGAWSRQAPTRRVTKLAVQTEPLLKAAVMRNHTRMQTRMPRPGHRASYLVALAPLTLPGTWGAPSLCQSPQQMLQLPSFTLIRKRMASGNTLSPGLPLWGPLVSAVTSPVKLLSHPDPRSQNFHSGRANCPRRRALSSLVLSVACTSCPLWTAASWELVFKPAPHPPRAAGLSSTSSPQPGTHTELCLTRGHISTPPATDSHPPARVPRGRQFTRIP